MYPPYPPKYHICCDTQDLNLMREALDFLIRERDEMDERLEKVEENDDLVFLESELKDHIAYLLDAVDELNERLKIVERRFKRRRS